MPLTEHSIRQYYNRLLRSIGIHNERRKRHEFSVHGFGKYFKTKAELAGVKPAVEMLMGHSLDKANIFNLQRRFSMRLVDFIASRFGYDE
jgi:hypothetical protein